MAAVISNNVVLSFKSSLYGSLRVTIPRARMTLTEAEVRGAMENMIDNGAILSPSMGVPVGIRSAELITTERSPLIY